MEDSNEHLLQLAELILPEEIFEFFDIVKIDSNAKQVDIHLDEKHEKPEGYELV